MRGRLILLVSPLLLLLALSLAVAQYPADDAGSELFRTADACMACHNGLTSVGGEDLSIGYSWRASMMANSARDPYWHAAVRREILDFPEDGASIENECSTCHMPMSSFEEKDDGGRGQVFAHLPIGHSGSEAAAMAANGVSYTVCHQIEGDNFRQPESFTGGFLIDRDHPWEERRIFGPFEVDEERAAIMRSATPFQPTESSHIQESEMCATCHTLYTHSLGPGAGVRFPEQMPYLEWLNSDYREEQSCQSCHMPVVADSAAITSVLGQPRSGVSRHVFLGGNVFMLGMLNRYRAELGVTALPQELEAAARRTEAHLGADAATLSLEGTELSAGRIQALVRVESLAGHKLPTAYPSRRDWIEFSVRDADGRALFSSGALLSDGSIAGNDNDREGGDVRGPSRSDHGQRAGPDLRDDPRGPGWGGHDRPPHGRRVPQGQPRPPAGLR